MSKHHLRHVRKLEEEEAYPKQINISNMQCGNKIHQKENVFAAHHTVHSDTSPLEQNRSRFMGYKYYAGWMDFVAMSAHRGKELLTPGTFRKRASWGRVEARFRRSWSSVLSGVPISQQRVPRKSTHHTAQNSDLRWFRLRIHYPSSKSVKCSAWSHGSNLQCHPMSNSGTFRHAPSVSFRKLSIFTIFYTCPIYFNTQESSLLQRKIR